MNFSRFSVSLDKNKPANSKNGVIQSKNNKSAKLSGVIAPIDIDLIEDNPEQARSYICKKEFETLKQSIRREGLLHPIIVYKDKERNKYFVKAGHRRLMALKELGFTQVDCAIFTSKTEATFAAISTNEFAESIHPIDKGVEVESLIKEFKAQGLDVSMKDIAEFYGAAVSTIHEWRRYATIDKSIRAEIIKRNIRSKDFLRKATKICKNINLESRNENERLRLVNDQVFELINNKKEKTVELSEKTKNLRDGPEIRNFLYYDKSRDEFLIRDVTKGLSSSERKRLKVKVEELLNQL